MSFDLSISFDDSAYLTPQIYLLASTLKGNIPNNAILHITTNRSDDDKALQYLKNSLNVKIYKRPKLWTLKSRCSYLLHSFKINSDKDWVIKLDVDVLALKHLKEFEKILDDKYDVVISPENRRIISNDNIEKRIWRNIYNMFNVPMPEWKMKFIEEGEGLPLFNTGIIALKSKYMERINDMWIPRTMMAENWLQYGIHPNEMALTSIIEDNHWNWEYLPIEFNLNPISKFRKGEFPSQELIPNAALPKETTILHWHKPIWLEHICEYNDNVREIVDECREYIPEDWWNLPMETFMERL